MQPDRKETPAERVIKCALPEYCLCKRLKNSPKTQDMYGKISVKFRGQRLTFYAKSDTHLFNRMLQQLPKKCPHSPPNPCDSCVGPRLSQSEQLLSPHLKMNGKLLLEDDPTLQGSSLEADHPITALRRGRGSWGSPSGCPPPPLYIHHTFKMNQWNSHKTRMRWWHDRITRESVS